MSEEYTNAAKKVGELADECSEDYDLACLLRAKSSKIMKLAQGHGMILKSSSDQSGEYETAVNE